MGAGVGAAACDAHMCVCITVCNVVRCMASSDELFYNPHQIVHGFCMSACWRWFMRPLPAYRLLQSPDQRTGTAQL